MPIEAEEIEDNVRALYTACGASLIDPPGSLRLARRLRHISSVQWMDHLLVPARLVANDNATFRVDVHSRFKANARASNWFVGHELNECWYSLPQHMYLEADREPVMQSATAALCVPGPGLRVALSCFGVDVPRIAKAFRTSEYVTSLRLAEAASFSVAIVGELWVHRRGPWFLGSDAELRRVATLGKHGEIVKAGDLSIARLSERELTLVFARD